MEYNIRLTKNLSKHCIISPTCLYTHQHWTNTADKCAKPASLFNKDGPDSDPLPLFKEQSLVRQVLLSTSELISKLFQLFTIIVTFKHTQLHYITVKVSKMSSTNNNDNSQNNG